jgi:uncharacterized protein YybS (DUF2232 family)
MNSTGYGVIGAVVKGSLLTLALFFLSRTIPLLGAIAAALIPFPCIYYSLKSAARVTGFAIVLLMVLFLALVSQDSLLPYLVSSVAISLLLPEFLVRGKGSTRALLCTVGLNVLLLAVLAGFAVAVFNIDVDARMRSIIHDSVVTVGETYRQSGLSGQELQALKDGLQLLEKLLVKLYPSCIILLFGVMAGINLLLLKKVSGSLGRDISFGIFSQYRNPDSLIWLVILAGFTLLTDSVMLTNIALNILVVLYFLYFVQGLAIIVWYATKKNLPRVLQGIFYVVLALQPLLTAVVAVFGLADLWVDIRAQKKIENL